MKRIRLLPLFFLLIFSLTFNKAHAQCFVLVWELSLEHTSAVPGQEVSMPMMADFSEVYLGAGSIEFTVAFDPAVLHYQGVGQVDNSVKGIFVQNTEPGRVHFLWNRSPSQTMSNSLFVGQLLVLDFMYLGGRSDVAIEDVMVRDAYTNSRMGLVTNGSVKAYSQHQLSLNSHPADIGADLQGAGTYYNTQQVSIAASEPINYRFSHWSNAFLPGMPSTVTTSSTSFTMPPRNVSLTAHYEQIHSDPVFLTLAFAGNGQVAYHDQVFDSGDGPVTLVFNRDDRVLLEATASDRWVFSGWGNGTLSGQPVLDMVISDDMTLTATFVREQYNLTLQVEGAGSVFIGSSTYGTGSYTLSYAAPWFVSFSQAASEGWAFSHWESSAISGGRSETATVDVLVGAGTTLVKAVFTELPKLASLHLGESDGGQVLVNGTPAEGDYSLTIGSTVTLEAHAGDDWLFTGWTGDPDDLALLDDPAASTTSLVMPDRDIHLAPTYIRLYNITFRVSLLYADGLHHPLVFNANADHVVLSGDLFAWKQEGTEEAYLILQPADEPDVYEVVLQLPAGHYSYTYFVNDGQDHPEWDDQAARDFTVTDQDLVLTDWFGFLEEPERKYIISLETGPNGHIEPSGEVVIGQDESLTLTITPDVGYHVADILIDGESVGNEYSLVIENIQSHLQVMVLFAINTYTLLYEASDNGAIEGEAIQQVTHGSSGTQVTAIAPEGYHFEQWSDDRTDNPRTDTLVTTDYAVSAIFAVNTYSVSVEANEGGRLSVDEDITLNHGDDLTIDITPDEGFHVEDVIVNGISLGPLSSLSVSNISEDQHIQVVFALNTYIVSVTAGEGGSLSQQGELTVSHGDTLAIDITPETGYHVADVLVDGVSTEVDGVLLLSGITANHSIEVVFAINMYTIAVTSGEHGQASPGEDFTTPHGSSVTLVFTPDTGYHIEEVLVNGVSHGQTGELHLENVDGDMQVHVTFALTTFSLQFDIRDARNGDVITDARITINEVAYDAGEYNIQHMVPDTYYYTITRDGYFELTDSVTIADADLAVVVELTVDNTSVADISYEAFRAWPVPATDVMWVAFENRSMTSTRITLYDLQGRTIREFPVHETGQVQVQLDLQTLRPGMYLLKIHSDQLFPAQQIMVR